MQEYMDLLGRAVEEKVTGITGIVTSISFDLNGCVQAIVKQRADKDGKVPESFWHDVKRLEVKHGDRVMTMPRFATMPVGAEAGPEQKPVQ